MKRPQVVDSEARRQVINGGHMRKQALALLHTWTWVTSRMYAESHRQAAIGDRPGPRVMQSCSCVRARTRGGINNERYAALRPVLTWLADPMPPAADGAPIRSSPCRDRQSDSDAAKAPEARSAPVGETDRTNTVTRLSTVTYSYATGYAATAAPHTHGPSAVARQLLARLIGLPACGLRCGAARRE